MLLWALGKSPHILSCAGVSSWLYSRECFAAKIHLDTPQMLASFLLLEPAQVPHPSFFGFALLDLPHCHVPLWSLLVPEVFFLLCCPFFLEHPPSPQISHRLTAFKSPSEPTFSGKPFGTTLLKFKTKHTWNRNELMVFLWALRLPPTSVASLTPNVTL